MSIEHINRINVLKANSNENPLYEEEIRLKNEAGNELFELFKTVWNNYTNGFYINMIKKSSDLKGEYLQREFFIKEMDFHARTYLTDISEHFKSDQRIVSAFNGKIELLNKLIEFGISSTINEAKFF